VAVAILASRYGASCVIVFVRLMNEAFPALPLSAGPKSGHLSKYNRVTDFNVHELQREWFFFFLKLFKIKIIFQRFFFF